MDADESVRDYLNELERLAQRATPAQATEIVADVREHIEAAFAEAGVRDAETARAILDRLGPAESIVGSADDGGMASLTGGYQPSQAHGWRHSFARFGPWAVGAAAGALGLALYLPPMTTVGFPAPLLPILVVPLVFAVALLRRPGGAEFLAAALGVAGALTIALAMSAPLSCPQGEFSSGCTGPRLAPMVLPSLGMIILGALILRTRRNRHAGQ